MGTAFAASIALPPVVRSVPAARRMITELLSAWAAENCRDDAGLLVTELVTNVIRHVDGAESLLLQVELDESLLRISVRDGSPALPVPRPPGSSDPGGHGLWLLAAVAHRWGIDEHGSGKQVWFELRRAVVDQR